MKPPEEIKKGLDCCVIHGFSSCHPECPYFDEGNYCKSKMHSDASTYIAHLESGNETKQKRIDELESRLAQVERERDAAVHDIRNAKWCLCQVCDNYFRPDKAVRHYECKVLGKFSDIFAPSEFSEDDNPISMCGKFKWRGVCAENTEEETE